MMTPEEFTNKMRELYDKPYIDVEIEHAEANDMMCDILRELGYGEGVAIFEGAVKWYA